MFSSIKYPLIFLAPFFAVIAVAASDFLTVSSVKSEPPRIASSILEESVKQEIADFCRTLNRGYSVDMVITCINQQVAVAVALNGYLDSHSLVVARCRELYTESGLYYIKACVEREIEVATALSDF